MTIPTPKGRQKQVVNLPPDGNTVVLGTAGSGKTTMAILRAAALSHSEAANSGPAILLTFNKTLILYMKAMAPPNMNRVHIATFHSYVRQWVIANGIDFNAALTKKNERLNLIDQAVRTVSQKRQHPSVLGRPSRFLESELAWIQSHGIMTADAYEKIERAGRGGQRLVRADRDHVFAVLIEYQRLRSLRGRQFDWNDIATFVRSLPIGPSRFRHFIIDEGQDFTPEMLRTVANAVPNEGSLTWFGDYAQQIYGQRMSWREAGLPKPKMERFEDNYRNTLEIANLALEVAEMPYFDDTPDLVTPKAPIASGPPPLLQQFASESAELNQVAQLAQTRAGTRSTAVLFFSRQDERAFEELLTTKSTSLSSAMAAWVDGPGLWHGTYHSAKGLEFDTVFLPKMSDGAVPDQKNVTAYGLPSALRDDGKLFYVGITRARSELIISHTGIPSDLIPESMT